MILGSDSVHLSTPDPEAHSSPPPSVSLSLTLKDGSAALDFYQRALGAEELSLMGDPGSNVGKARAVEAGAVSLSEPQDYFWGLRSSIALDPFGYRWSLAQLIEEVSPGEVQRRAEELMGGG